MSLPVLDLKIDSLVRERREVLRAIAWRVLPGEHWVIVGPNGAGKSSLLQVLAGYLWPTRGSVSVLGERFGSTDLRDLRKAIGVVSSTIVDWMPAGLDVLTTVAGGFEAAIGEPWVPITTEQRAAARAALASLEVDALAAREYGTLSQGERQRVMIARALVHRPALLILDEPCAGLDPVARERFLLDLARLAATRGAPSIALVTHHLEEIPPFATHALVLGAGHAVASGPVDRVVTSAVMSEAFGVPCEVRTADGRRTLVPRLS